MNNFMNFILKIFEMFKSDAKTAIAKYILFGGLGLAGWGSFSINYKNKENEYSFIYSDNIDVIGYILVIIGLFLLLKRYFDIQRSAPILVYSRGLVNMDINEPIKVIPKYERYDTVLIEPKEINSYDRNIVLEEYRFIKKLIKDRILNKNISKIYIASLGSFPYLFLLGSLFRNAYSQLIVLDYNRNDKGGYWYKLPEIDSDIEHILMYENMTIDEKLNELNKSEFNEIGIALSYTFEINKDAIPKNLQTNTLYLQHSKGFGHDKISNQKLQIQLIYELSQYIAKVWNKHNKIHLFVSAQASFCINLGKNYMDNAHGILVLHNYNNESKTYNWSVKFNKGNIVND